MIASDAIRECAGSKMVRMMKTGKLIVTCCVLLVGMLMFSNVFCEVPGQADSWKSEFERICAQTEIATSLSPQELRELISDSDKLLEKLGESKDSGAKIYLFRLKNCKAFFEYALQVEENHP